MKGDTFTLTEEHLTLLKVMYVGWQDCETGAPEIDPKRPYGNSDVARDVWEMLDWFDIDSLPEEDQDDFYESDEYDVLHAKAMKLHEETGTALQIILQNQSFQTGTYTNMLEWSDEWKLTDDGSCRNESA